jgi:pyrimidine deaminase RibD-like protein
MFSMAAKVAFMEEALAVSAGALPGCLPNPPVGCVIVHRETVVARGFTGRPGEHHAEPAALAGLEARWPREELVLFVTLEPCSFVGRTPSCARALIGAGIRHVIVGTLDPDPRNGGRGIQMLREAGVMVEVGVAEQNVLAFIGPYLFGSQNPQIGSGC